VLGLGGYVCVSSFSFPGFIVSVESVKFEDSVLGLLLSDVLGGNDTFGLFSMGNR